MKWLLGLGHSTGGFAHNAGGSIGHSGHGETHFPAGGVAYGGGHQDIGGWQPTAAAAGYQAGAATPTNNGWVLRKRSSEKDDSGWSLESKEDEVFARPNGKVSGKTSTTRRPASGKKDKVRSAV